MPKCGRRRSYPQRSSGHCWASQQWRPISNLIARQIVRLDANRFVARDGRVDAGNAQAAFLVLMLSTTPTEHGVDEYLLCFLRLALAFDVGHEQSIRQIDLVGREPYAFVRVHQLEHLVDDGP